MNRYHKLKKYKKKHIPKAIKEQVWIRNFGQCFNHKCYISWCKNNINVFNFHVGHNIPESRGGKINLSNLKPICSRCNHSMSNNYSITQWNKLGPKKQPKCCLFF